MSRQTKHRKKRREHGLCAREGCKVVCGTYYCPEHAWERNEYRKARGKQQRAAQGAAA